jgi:DNA-binding SARP family transcriptional activator
MSRLGNALHLLGGIEVECANAADAQRLLAQSKAIGLIAYLALAPRGRYQRRDRLVGLLWPDLDQTHARAALRKAVLTIRRTFGDAVLDARGDEEIMLVPEQLLCDATEFVALTDAERFAEASSLYRGELMPGFHLAGCSEYGRWLEDQRTALVRRASAAAWGIARGLEEGRHFTEAGFMACRASRYAWSDERVLRRAMLMLQRIGDKGGALRLFADFARRLRGELDAEPSSETSALATSMRKG